MTPDTLLELLAASPADAPLVFRTDQGEIRGGYHVTELKLAEIQSIDCGARRSTWRELTLQILDGTGGDHMTVNTFRQILRRCAENIQGLGATPMQVEFAHENNGLRIYELAAPQGNGARITIDLSETRAQCKPAQQTEAKRSADGAACCAAKGSGASARSCC